MTTHQKGQMAEEQACHYLMQHGLTPVTKNYRSRYGEIDLIMQDEATLVFVEVRLRQHPDFGNPVETVTPTKQQRISRTALAYLQQEQLIDTLDCRFDVLGIDGKANIVWIKNAFEVQY